MPERSRFHYPSTALSAKTPEPDEDGRVIFELHTDQEVNAVTNLALHPEPFEHIVMSRAAWEQAKLVLGGKPEYSPLFAGEISSFTGLPVYLDHCPCNREDSMTDPIDPVPEPTSHGEDPKPPDKVALPIPVKPLERIPKVGGWLAGLLRRRLQPFDKS